MKHRKKGRILILGVSGFIGSSLAYYLRHEYSVTGAYFTNPITIPDVHCLPMDLKNKDIVDRFMRMLEPDYTIMATGLNDLMTIENNIKLSDALNTYVPLSFAQAAVQTGAKNIHLSCAQVFDGTTSNTKEDEKNFSTMNFGRAKAAAEGFIRAQTMENTTIRFGKVLGMSNVHRPSSFDLLRSTLSLGERYYVRDEKTYNYMSIISIVKAIHQILQKPFPASHRLFHLGGVAMQELEMQKEMAKFLNLDPNLVRHKGASVEEESTHHVKKRDYTLDCSRFEEQFDWKAESMEELKDNLRLQMTPHLSSEIDFIISKGESVRIDNDEQTDTNTAPTT